MGGINPGAGRCRETTHVVSVGPGDSRDQLFLEYRLGQSAR